KRERSRGRSCGTCRSALPETAHNPILLRADGVMRARARQDDSRVAWVVDTPSGETETIVSAAADDSFGPPGASFPRAFAPEVAPAGSLPLPARGDGAGEGASRSRLRAHLARREPANDDDWGMAEQRIPYPRK